MTIYKRAYASPMATVVAALFLVTACGEQQAGSTTEPPAAEASFTDTFRTALETAKPGDVIEVPAGTHTFKRSLVMNTDGVTIRGAGMDQSILSLKGQADRFFRLADVGRIVQAASNHISCAIQVGKDLCHPDWVAGHFYVSTER